MASENNNFPSPTPKPPQIRSQISISTKSIFALILICACFFFMTQPKRNVSSITVSGNQLSMVLDGQKISSTLSDRKSVQMLLNNGEMTSFNTANFVFISMEKVKYLEQKYKKSFIYCLSDGEQEAKESLLHITVIAKTKSAENNLRSVVALIKNGNLVVVNTVGQELRAISGFTDESKSYGFFVVRKTRPEVYFLLDEMNLIDEKYQ